MAEFSIMSILILVVFILVIGSIFLIIGMGVAQWSKNNKSPISTVIAVVVAKRTNVSGGVTNINDNISDDTSTSYYVTFELESKERLEFLVRGSEYGILVEGDKGQLTFQGTRYKGFKRSL